MTHPKPLSLYIVAPAYLYSTVQIVNNPQVITHAADYKGSPQPTLGLSDTTVVV